MMIQGISGIVAGAKGRDAEMREDSLGRKLFLHQPLIGQLPYRRCSAFIQQLLNREVSEQFEMGPMVERIAQSIRNGSGPGQKLFIRLGPSGAVVFRTPLARMARHL